MASFLHGKYFFADPYCIAQILHWNLKIINEDHWLNRGRRLSFTIQNFFFPSWTTGIRRLKGPHERLKNHYFTSLSLACLIHKYLASFTHEFDHITIFYMNFTNFFKYQNWPFCVYSLKKVFVSWMRNILLYIIDLYKILKTIDFIAWCQKSLQPLSKVF